MYKFLLKILSPYSFEDGHPDRDYDTTLNLIFINKLKVTIQFLKNMEIKKSSFSQPYLIYFLKFKLH